MFYGLLQSLISSLDHFYSIINSDCAAVDTQMIIFRLAKYLVSIGFQIRGSLFVHLTQASFRLFLGNTVHLCDSFDPDVPLCIDKNIQHIVSVLQEAVGTAPHKNARPLLRQLANRFCLLQKYPVIQRYVERYSTAMKQIGKETVILQLGLFKKVRMNSAALCCLIK